MMDVAKLKLPGISREGQQILTALSRSDVELGDIADLVARDPAAAAMVIKYANSPLYRRRFEITNVRHAVHLLGLKNVRVAVVVVTLRAYANPPSATKEIIWEHAFGVSVLAKLLADIACPQWSDDIVLSALLHDVGALVLASNFPDRYEDLIRIAAAGGLPVEQLEQVRFGTNHLLLIRELAPTLRIPERTAEVIVDFFDREPLVELRDEADYHHAVIALANLLERELYSPKGHLIKRVPDDRDVLQLALGIGDDRLSDLMDQYEALYDEHYANI